MKQDITKRLCKGAPPQVILMPTTSGPQMRFHFPLVDSVMDGCALHKKKSPIDTIQGND